jgi:hypothetical protein
MTNNNFILLKLFYLFNPCKSVAFFLSDSYQNYNIMYFYKVIATSFFVRSSIVSRLRIR